MIFIQNGRILDPKSKTDVVMDLVIDHGKIIAMESGSKPSEKDLVIDAAGLVVAPGLIDVHVHFRDPGSLFP